MRMTSQQEVQNFVLRLLNETQDDEDFWKKLHQAFTKYNEDCL